MADLRASDAQREHAATALREHFAAGRLTHEELDERVQRAYAARTERDLQTLMADLPALPVSRAQSHAELVARRADLRRQLIQQTGALNTPFIVCTVMAGVGRERLLLADLPAHRHDRLARQRTVGALRAGR